MIMICTHSEDGYVAVGNSPVRCRAFVPSLSIYHHWRETVCVCVGGGGGGGDDDKDQ